jgi:hypothetical protein
MKTLTSYFNGGECCNPSLGLATKARACEGVAKNETWESHFMLSGVWESVRE